uniref:hypothetical protein n=1 Tax=Wolbachia endosymbiont (group A) of Gymnosoma rotundatum TaxID=2954016 RepID=UPI002225CD2E|nr:hypothetical protein [Wolbachia endosymbiont (group A) of Gymnosoma rotundatum]
MLLACYSHKHISYRIRTIIRKAILDQNFIVDQPNKVWDYLHQNQGGMAIFGSNNSHVW